MSGRKKGTTEVTLDEMKVIAEKTRDGESRPEIADRINRSQNTVYRYQKKLNLLG